MDLVRFITARGGIAHSHDLHRAGATKYAVQAAVRQGDLIRVRRDWVAERECPSALVRAVRIGGAADLRVRGAASRALDGR